jgi:hypothetical protein
VPNVARAAGALRGTVLTRPVVKLVVAVSDGGVVTVTVGTKVGTGVGSAVAALLFAASRAANSTKLRP